MIDMKMPHNVTFEGEHIGNSNYDNVKQASVFGSQDKTIASKYHWVIRG